MSPTNGRTPRTGERPLRVQYRNGVIPKHEYTARQMRWNDTGDGWDIVGVERA